MANDKDDYAADIQFGEWLRSQRVRVGLSLEDASRGAFFVLERLKGLEMGLSKVGITRAEANRLASAYRLEVREILERANKG